MQTSNILNGVKWQQLKKYNNDSAVSVINYLNQTYNNLPVTQATIDIQNSLENLKNSTVAQLCQWVELNKGYRIKNNKDFNFIVHTIICNH